MHTWTQCLENWPALQMIQDHGYLSQWKKAKELVHSGAHHDWNHVWIKKTKTRYKEVIPTMVETLDKNNQSIVQTYCW